MIDVGPNLMKIQLPIEKTQLCRQYLSAREIIIGIRPEDITLSQEKTATSFSAQVEVIEPLGMSQIIRLKMNSISIRVRSEGISELTVDSSIHFTMKEKKIHIFDKNSEKRIA